MDSVFEAYLRPDNISGNALLLSATEPDDIPKINTNVWILGQCYNSINDLELIRRDIRSKLWCTYRRGFVPIGESQLTSDKGWGCMLRCGQMVLGQALIDLHLGRDWYWTPETRDPNYLKIIQRFEDSRKSFFSIHQIALMGQSEDKKVGEWFGPNTVAQVIKKLVGYDDWCSIVIHVALDNTIAKDDIYELRDGNHTMETLWKPLLLIIPLRLGLNEINTIYINALKKCFELNGSLGMIGGRPNQALYFIGYVDDEVIFLDPHTIQPAGCIGNKLTIQEIELDETYHQRYAQRIKFTQMDPSLALCFLCKTRVSFEILLDQLQNEVNTPGNNQSLFEITKTRSTPWISPEPSASTSASINNRNFQTINKPRHQSDDFEQIHGTAMPQPNENPDSDDDFEIIS